MPPKGRSPRRSGGSHTGRRNFSIATFFDAASSTVGRRGGTGYRLGGSGGAPPALSHMASVLRGGHAFGGNEEEEDGDYGENSTGYGVATGYSATLQEVRSRILAEVAEEQEAVLSGRRPTGPSRLHQHRQRALQIAFDGNGEAGGGGSQGPSPSQRFSNRGSTGGDGNDECDDGLMVSSVEFSLLCPYSRLPMVHPVRSRDCRHVQCCDLESWMVLLDKCRSMRDPKGPCPVCEQRVAASSLEVDFWMMNVMAQMPPGTHLVELDADGSYRNGDLTREKRKEHIATEIIDATQDGDYENYLGDVLDDDTDTYHPPPPRPARPQSQQQQQQQQARGKRQRPPSPTAVGSSQENSCVATTMATTTTNDSSSVPPLASVKKEKYLQQQQQQRLAREEEGPPTAADPTRDSSSTEEHGRADADEPAQGLRRPIEEPLPSQDPGVVIVHYIEGRATRTLPSQVRLWVPHCPTCQAPLLKGEDGLMEACRSCGQTAHEQWTLVRRFEESSAVSMELTPDDTLVLRGVDAAAAYLLRAGFQRSMFGPPPIRVGTGGAALGGQRGPTGVWTTSFPLTRVEFDFLEACCQRIARGEDLDELGATMPVPPLFRIPRRRGANGGGQFGSQQPRGGGGGARSVSVAASGNAATGLSQQQRPYGTPYHPLFAGH